MDNTEGSHVTISFLFDINTEVIVLAICPLTLRFRQINVQVY